MHWNNYFIITLVRGIYSFDITKFVKRIKIKKRYGESEKEREREKKIQNANIERTYIF